MLELLAPAGSPEGVIAAVRNGADALYMGFGNYNARKNAKNFTEDEFARAAEYCRVRGVKVYVTLNTLASDRELPGIAEQAKTAARLGADAILVQDLGVLKAIRQAVPDMPVHASTQMSIHDLEGVKVAAAMGLSRVVLARELSRDEIAYICKYSPVEIEVFAHGALCMCYSGQCYMSSVIGRRSGNRGLCAQPCRLPYHGGARGNDYPLSLRDNCLADYMHDMESIGVACVKIEGRMRRPEYGAIVSDVYSRAIRNKQAPGADDHKLLDLAFSRGFTDGYYTDRHGALMFGVRGDGQSANDSFFASVKRAYSNGEYQRVPVRFNASVKEGRPAVLYAVDDRNNTVCAEGPVPEPAKTKPLDKVTLQTQLYKTGGTPYLCEGVKSEVGDGLSIPTSAINEMRRSVLSQLTEKRSAAPEHNYGEFVPGYRLLNREDAPVITVSVLKLSQLSMKLASLPFDTIYIPLEEFDPKNAVVTTLLNDESKTVAVTLPRIIHDNELEEIGKMLHVARAAGVKTVLAGNLSHAFHARSMGFDVRGDFGLNIYNSQTLRILKDIGFKSATLSFEMRLEQINQLSKPIDCELIVYGRLPLMITENCVIKSASGVCSCTNFPGLTDKNGFIFPVVRSYKCRSTVLNSRKLFLADKSADYSKIGLWGARVCFTTENPSECVSVLERYLGLGGYDPVDFTRGLYYRGVE